MPPINGPQNANVLPPPPRTSQPYSPANLYNAHSQYVASTQENIAVGTSSIAFMSQPSQEIQHRPIMIPPNQMPPVAKNLTPVSVSSTFADTIKSEPAKMNQSYQWATNPPSTNIPQGTRGVPGVSSSIDKTSHVSTDQITTESQTSFARVNKFSAYNQGHSVPSPASNVNLPPSNVTHLNQNSYVQQEPMSSGIQPRTQNVQAQSMISPESLSNPQLRYGSQQNISNASSVPNSSTQNLFYSAQAHNVSPRNLHDYSSQPVKSQNLLTGYMDPTGLGSNSQSQNIHQNLAGQRKYPQQDTANTMMLPPLGGNQLQGARLPPSGIPPLSGLQTVIESKNKIYAIESNLINLLYFLQKMMYFLQH